ncbi:MAG: hypothetical protein RTU30_09020 [Candidatus Thorarchaeota archaeon]
MRVNPEMLILTIIVSGLAIQPITTPVLTSMEGLYWGIQDQQEVHYNIEDTNWDENGSSHIATYRITAIVNVTNNIPDYLAGKNQIPYLDLLWYYQNGTDFDYYSAGITHHLATLYVLPVGNWTLLSNLYSASNSEVEQSVNAWYCNFSGEIHMRCPGRECHFNFTESMTHLKSDGVLVRNMVVATVFNSSELLFERMIERNPATFTTSTSDSTLTQPSTSNNPDWFQVILLVTLIPSGIAATGVVTIYLFINRSIRMKTRT